MHNLMYHQKSMLRNDRRITQTRKDILSWNREGRKNTKCTTLGTIGKACSGMTREEFKLGTSSIGNQREERRKHNKMHDLRYYWRSMLLANFFFLLSLLLRKHNFSSTC